MGTPEQAFATDFASLLSVPTGAVDALDRIALAVFLITFVALALQYREFCTPLDGVFIAVARTLGSTCETWQEWLDAHGPDFGVVRNSAVLLVAFTPAYPPTGGPGVVHWVACTAAALCLLDFGQPISRGPWIFGDNIYMRIGVYVSLTIHHAGTIIPVVFQAYEDDPTRQHRNAALFSYLWLCHGFPQLQAWAGFLPGKHYTSLEIARYVYSLGNVYLLSLYLSEPGLGMNYQTLTVIVVLSGRYFFTFLFDIAWMHFEFVGTSLVVATSLFKTLPPGPGHALAALPVAFVMVAEMVVIVKRAEDASNASSASEAREAKIARWRRPSKGEILRGSLSGTLDIDATKAD